MDELTPFAFWCQKVMPAVLDDSLSFYEVLCKLTAKLNNAIETINGHSELITTMQSEIDALQTLTAQHTQQIADLTKKVQANADNITAINTRTKGLSTKTDSSNNYWGINFTTDDNYVYRLAWSNGAPAASVLQTSRPGSIYYQNGGVSEDWAYLSVQDSTNTSRPGYTSISRTIYNQITSDINDVESSAAQNAQAIKALQDLTGDHSTAISNLQDSVGRNTQAITDINTRTKGLQTKTGTTDGWQGFTIDTDDKKHYRLAWIDGDPTTSILGTSSPGSIYLYKPSVSSSSYLYGWSQNSATGRAILYNGVGKSTMDDINTQIRGLDNRISALGSRTVTLENKTKGFSTVNDTVSGWFGFNLLVGSDNYRIGWSPSAPIEAVTEASAPGSLYLTQTGLTGNTYGYSQTGTQEVKTLYNGSDTSSIENEIETLQTTVSGHTQQISTLMDDVNNNVSDINDLQNNLAGATNTITQVGNLVNEINTRTKGISTKTDSSDNWIGISLSTDDSYIYRVAWSNETPALPVLQQSSPGSLYLRIGGPAPDIWLYAWDQDGTDTAMPLVTEKI